MAVLERDVEVYVSSETTGWNSTNTRRIKINSGSYNFNQSVNIARYGRNELAGTSSRDASAYVASVEKATASLSHYLNPRLDGSVGDSAEKPLWIQLCGSTSDYNTYSSPSTQAEITFSNSNIARLKQGTLWFAYPNGDRVYRLNNTNVNSVDINFGIGTFPTITWDLAADSMTDLGSYSGNIPTNTNTTTERTCIIGKLTTISLEFDSANIFDLALTSGNISINNNITYTGRKRIGQVFTYEDHYSGDRAVEGSLGFYLHTGNNKGADLLDYLLTNKDDLENNLANITINIGGTTSPYVKLYMPNVLLNVPNLAFNQAATLSTNFLALESSVGAGDELTITYFI